MHWLSGVYTKRFNIRHRLCGHVLAGRYKAPLVEGSGNGYLRTPMKRLTITTALICALALLWFLLSPRRDRARSSGVMSQPGRAQTNSPAQTSATNTLERLARLERLGSVPEDADYLDWILAQKTSWWGKRLDPKAFWKGRVVWLDRSASMAAHRHGRYFPPIPYEDPGFSHKSDTDELTTHGMDTSDVTFRITDRENAFWDQFAKTHPPPPEVIGISQRQVAYQVLGSHFGYERDSNGRRPPRDLHGMDEHARAIEIEVGIPPEALTDDALRWAYVLDVRQEFERDYVRPHHEGTVFASNFLARVWVDPALITQKLSDNQLKAANAWKIAYLRRLRGASTEDAYLEAYLQAWNLTAAEVFGQ
jgi:hypothetical protein